MHAQEIAFTAIRTQRDYRAYPASRCLRNASKNTVSISGTYRYKAT
jgi:hypothetical protein